MTIYIASVYVGNLRVIYDLIYSRDLTFIVFNHAVRVEPLKLIWKPC